MDSPAGLLKNSADSSVSRPIAADFRFPVSLSGFRHATVPAAAVPEATIDEDGDMFATKDEIGFARER